MRIDGDNLWRALRFLESTANLRGPVQRVSGRQPSTTLLTEISTCLLHARLFHENGERSPLEIRPLLLHYSAINFAKALVLSMTGRGHSTLAQSHGLSFTAEGGGSLVDGKIKVVDRGTFQALNDAAARVNRLRYFDDHSSEKEHLLPSATSDQLAGTVLSLQEVFSNLPTLDETYARTFGTPSRVIQFDLHLYGTTDWRLRIDDAALYTDRASMQAQVASLRARMPFLGGWRILRTEQAWGKSVFTFTNVAPTATEFDAAELREQGIRFEATDAAFSGTTPFDALPTLPPVAGGYSAYPCFIPPINGAMWSEYTLSMMALHGLSSIVRYQPHVWTAAVARRALPERQQDDHVLALIEEFLSSPPANFANLVACVLLQG